MSETQTPYEMARFQLHIIIGSLLCQALSKVLSSIAIAVNFWWWLKQWHLKPDLGLVLDLKPDLELVLGLVIKTPSEAGAGFKTRFGAGAGIGN